MTRFGRIPQFDEKSRGFPIRTLVAAATPRSYTWSCGTVLNQGNEGSCVGHAWAHELIARPAPVADVTHDTAVALYYAAQALDEWPGGEYPGADPTYEGTSVLAGAKATQNAGRIGEYRWAFGLEDLILAIGYKGPAILGINWHDGMERPDTDGTIHVTGPVLGGHAIMANAVSIRLKRIGLVNSWGAGWGLNGRAFVSFDDMRILLADEGEACIPMGRVR